MKKCTTADRLKEVMSERNLRQVDILEKAKPLCEKYKLKLGRNDLSQYISGKVEPRQNKLFILAEVLNVNETWLMGYDVSPKRDHAAAAAFTHIVDILSGNEDNQEQVDIVHLDDVEKQLIKDYRTLSTQGQEYILQTMNMAVNTYKKDNINKMYLLRYS